MLTPRAPCPGSQPCRRAAARCFALRGRRAYLHLSEKPSAPINVEPAISTAEQGTGDVLYQAPAPPPKLRRGPIELRMIPEKGRGVVVTRDVTAGSLLMVAEPAVLLERRAGRALKPEDLAQELQRRGAGASDTASNAPPPEEEKGLKYLALLADGSPTSGEQLPDLDDLISCGSSRQEVPLSDTAATATSPSSNEHVNSGSSSRSDSDAGSGPSTSGSGTAVAAAARWDARRLLKVVQLNCFGEPYGDLAACTARGEPLRSHIGVWPAFAMLNSSCLPNAAGMVLGRRMVVRATRDIAAGEEACITYLGQFVSSPYQERQSRLRQSFGFQCTCDRCLLEQEHEDGAAAAMHRTWRRLVRTLEPQVVAAVDAEERKAVRRLYHELLGIAASVQADLAGVEDPYEHACLSAGVYKCHELLSMCGDALQDTAVAAPAQGPRRRVPPAGTAAAADVPDDQLPVRLRLLQLFAPGSYSHAALSAEHLKRVRAAVAGGRDGRRAGGGTDGGWKLERAMKWCLQAHTARYGQVGDMTLASLVDGHDNNALLDSLVAGQAAVESGQGTQDAGSPVAGQAPREVAAGHLMEGQAAVEPSQGTQPDKRPVEKHRVFGPPPPGTSLEFRWVPKGQSRSAGRARSDLGDDM